MTGVNGERYDGLGFASAFNDHDMAALARLTAAERESQFDARQRLWWFVDQVWDQARAEARNPSQDPRYRVIAELRDLLAELRAHAGDAIAAAGDDRG